MRECLLVTSYQRIKMLNVPKTDSELLAHNSLIISSLKLHYEL